MKALVADHSRTARRILREMIAELAPELEVDTAETGPQAVAMHALCGHDLLFLDMALPELDGLGALAAIRAADPQAFVAMLSASGDPLLIDRAESAGASAFLAKPFSTLDVQGALAAVTGRPAAIRILLIDDSRAHRAIMRSALDALGASSVVEEAVDGPEGLRQALCGRYDLIFLDVNMPRLQGVEVLREIKRGQKRAKVIMTSADVDAATEERFFALGADACVKKPIVIPELLACISKMLDVRRPTRRPAA